MRLGFGRLAFLAFFILVPLLIPAPALAQNTGIAGVVKDTSGAVMPGVTVEASSPVLIEKVRSVVTDAQGLYAIVDLRPGVYSVAFTIPGFSTLRREGVELVGSFTATVNADLRVGAVEETITVSADAPIVDTRNVVQLQVLSDEVMEALPTGRTVLFMAALIPGTTRTTTVGRPHDLAGTSDSRGASMIHGGRAADYQLTYDGTPTDLGGNGASQSWQTNSQEIEEFVYRLGALSAENPFGGIAANLIPKDGGNRFTSALFYAFTGKDLQSDNRTQAMKDLNISNTGLEKHWDANFSVGGPIFRDKLWFFSSYRNQGNDEAIVGNFEAIDPRSFVYNPKLGAEGNVDVNKPGIYLARNYFYSSRFTYQATPKNKFAVYVSSQPRHNYGFTASGTVSAESSRNQEFGNQLFGGGSCGRDEGCGPLMLHQVSWKSPITSKLLAEANYGFNHMYGCRCVPFGDQAHLYAGPDVIAVMDAGTGYTYRSAAAGYDFPEWQHDSAKATLSYITGAHSSKFGFDADWGGSGTTDQFHNQNMTFRFQNGTPNRITIFNEPYTDRNGDFKRFGFFAQDQWTFRRLTLNGGLRLDLHNGSIPDTQTSGPNQFVPVIQRWPGVKNVPNWKDISPRFGVAYDLFGDGKTALKYTLGRYVVNDGTSFPSSVNPITFNRSANRSWNDRTACAGGIQNDYYPQECELGSLSNSAFATAATTTTVDDAIREGWGVRQNNWESAISIQHQLLPRLGVTFAYTKRWFNNFTTTDNKALVPEDYDEFCITAPTDTRLGSVSGSRICGLYDLNPAKRSVVPQNFRTSTEDYGTQKESWDGIDLNFNARLPRATIQGGLNSGPSGGNNTEACFVVDSPGALRFCDIQRPWRTNVRLLGSLELPYGINAGVTFLADPGAADIQATYSVANADITAGRAAFVNPARTTFGAGSVDVALLPPGQKYNDFLYQLDLRLSKAFVFRGARARITLDLANLTNTAQVFTQNTTFGNDWLRPIFVLQGRLIKPGFSLDF